jgi:Ca2+-binding EF-hand superfamily protein
MKKLLISAMGVLLTVSAVIFAQDTPQFSQADQNQDGVLNKTEADQALTALGIIDGNQDGVISKSDVKRALPDIEFEGDDDSAVGQTEYQKIVQILEELMDQA